MLKKKRRLNSDALAGLSASALAAIVGLFLALIILLVCDPKNAMPGFLTLITGGIREGGIKAVGDILYQATPIMMCGAGIAIAFKASVFNIGGGGQFLMGAFVGIYGAIKWEFLPGALRWIVPLVAAALSGALWAMVPGILKAFRNVNVIISTIMMNYLARYLINSLIKDTIFNSAKNETLPIPLEVYNLLQKQRFEHRDGVRLARLHLGRRNRNYAAITCRNIDQLAETLSVHAVVIGDEYQWFCHYLFVFMLL